MQLLNGVVACDMPLHSLEGQGDVDPNPDKTEIFLEVPGTGPGDNNSSTNAGFRMERKAPEPPHCTWDRAWSAPPTSQSWDRESRDWDNGSG